MRKARNARFMLASIRKNANTRNFYTEMVPKAEHFRESFLKARTFLHMKIYATQKLLKKERLIFYM